MGLKGIRKEDLSSGNLDRLIDELRKAISDGEYKTVEDFAKDFAGLVAGLEVKVTAEGKRELLIGTERVDFDAAVAKIKEPIEKAKNPDSPMIMDDAKRDEYYRMFAEVDHTLSGLFKQHEMMDVLVERKLSPDLFTQRVEQANAESQAKIDKYKDELKELKKLRSQILGKDDAARGKKSFGTEVRELQNAKGYLGNIPAQLDEIKALKEQIDKFNADVADPSKPAVTAELVQGHIDAAQARIAELKTSIGKSVESVKKYKISDIDLADVEAAIADTPTKTFDEAKAVAEKYLNGAGSTLSMDARIQKRYEKAAAEIVAKDAGIDPAVKAKLQATPLDPKAVDEYLAGLDKSIKSIEKAKKTEEILMVAREASAQEYKEKSDKFQDLGSKLQYVQAKDADGNLLYIDADGNTTTTAAGNQPKYATEQAKDPSGKLLYKDSTGAITTDDKDSAGNPNTPIMVPVLVAKDKAALLTDFDEDAKKTEIENGTEIKAMKVAAIDALTISERRAVLKKAGKYGPIRRFFRAFFKLDASDKAIRDAINDPAIDAKKTALLEEAKAGHIEAKTKPMAEEFLKGAPDIKAVQQVYDAEKKSAAIQERMQDGAYEITRNHADISDELIDALDGAAMESVAVAYAFEVLGNDKLKELLKKKGIRAKEADIEEASKQETLSAIVDKSTRNMSTPVIDNPDSPTHTDER